MKLKKCLSIMKCKNFSIFIYPKGHIKEQRGMDEVPLKMFDVERNEKGEISYGEFLEFVKCEVTEIIPHSSGINIVAELN